MSFAIPCVRGSTARQRRQKDIGIATEVAESNLLNLTLEFIEKGDELNALNNRCFKQPIFYRLILQTLMSTLATRKFQLFSPSVPFQGAQ